MGVSPALRPEPSSTAGWSYGCSVCRRRCEGPCGTAASPCQVAKPLHFTQQGHFTLRRGCCIGIADTQLFLRPVWPVSVPLSPSCSSAFGCSVLKQLPGVLFLPRFQPVFTSWQPLSCSGMTALHDRMMEFSRTDPAACAHSKMVLRRSLSCGGQLLAADRGRGLVLLSALSLVFTLTLNLTDTF